MSDQKQPIIDRINEVWGLHERRYEAPGPEGRCLAFFIDPRSVDFEGIELRLAVSFGDNPVTPETKQGFVVIPTCEPTDHRLVRRVFRPTPHHPGKSLREPPAAAGLGIA